MKTVSRGCLAVVAAVAVSMLAQCARTRDAETKITIYPGMEILQGSTVCKVSFVETRLTLAITCGSIGSIRIGPFVVDKAGIDKRDIGAPLDSMPGGDQAVIRGWWKPSAARHSPRNHGTR